MFLLIYEPRPKMMVVMVVVVMVMTGHESERGTVLGGQWEGRREKERYKGM
jgi:hypothetical protein